MAEKFCTPVKNRKEMLKIPPSPFLKRLGYGTGVTVYQFERSPKANSVRSPWALKMINSRFNKDTTFGKRLRDEATLLKKMDHPNIVAFRAFTKTTLGKECLAMEICTTSLGDLIENRTENKLLAFPEKNILKMSHNISRALDYLHVRMRLLHGDIKSHNVLVVNDFEACKLCDFGVSLPLMKSGEIDRETAGEDAEYVGTQCWSAPEIMLDSMNVTTKADIFAFGLVIWEMLSLEIPHASEINAQLNESSSFEESFKDNSEIFGTRPSIPYYMLGDNICDYKFALELFYCCTEQKPTERPTAHHLTLSTYEMIHADEKES